MNKVIGLLLLLALALFGRALNALELSDWFEYAWLNQTTERETKSKAVWLPRYHVDIDAQPLAGVANNLSGVTLNHDTQRIWVILNSPEVLIELDADLRPLRRITLRNFHDTEAVAYVERGYFVIAEERQQSLSLAHIDDDTQVIDRLALRQISLDNTAKSNKGLEGLAVNGSTIYAVREKNEQPFIQLQGFLNQDNIINIGKIYNQMDVALEDYSGLHFDTHSGNLLLTSDESKMLVELAPDGKRVSYLRLQKNLHGLKESVPQVEGVTLDHENNLIIVSEPNLIYRFKPSS